MGDRQTPEHRAAIGESMRRNWAKRNAIMAAMLNGDVELAMRLSSEYKNRFVSADGSFDARRCMSIRRDMYDTDEDYEAALESAATTANRYGASITNRASGQSDEEVARRFGRQILNELRKDQK